MDQKHVQKPPQKQADDVKRLRAQLQESKKNGDYYSVFNYPRNKWVADMSVPVFMQTIAALGYTARKKVYEDGTADVLVMHPPSDAEIFAAFQSRLENERAAEEEEEEQAAEPIRVDTNSIEYTELELDKAKLAVLKLQTRLAELLLAQKVAQQGKK